MVQRERFRDAPAAHDPGGDRRYPGDQPDAAPETPDLDVSETDARPRIRPRLDHFTGDLLDSTRSGRCDAPGSQPAGDGVAPSGRLERPDHHDIERFAADSAGRFEVDGGQRIEQVGGFTAALRGPRQRRPQRGPSLLEDGNHLPAQHGPRETWVLVGRIADRLESGRAHVRMKCSPRDPERRPRDNACAETPPVRDSSQTSCTASPQQVQQDGLDVIVPGVGGAQDVPGREDALERRVSGGARRSFVGVHGVARLQIRVQDHEPDRQSAADVAASVRPPCRIRVQVMIDVNRAQPHCGIALSTPGERMEQSERVRPSAEGDHEAGLRGERRRESGDEIRSERRLLQSVHAATAGPVQYAWRRSPVRSSTREAISSIDAALVSRDGIR